jgi:hypothetical protein
MHFHIYLSIEQSNIIKVNINHIITRWHPIKIMLVFFLVKMCFDSFTTAPSPPDTLVILATIH